MQHRAIAHQRCSEVRGASEKSFSRDGKTRDPPPLCKQETTDDPLGGYRRVPDISVGDDCWSRGFRIFVSLSFNGTGPPTAAAARRFFSFRRTFSSLGPGGALERRPKLYFPVGTGPTLFRQAGAFITILI